MLSYQVEWENFKGKMETRCNFYNLDKNIFIRVILYRTYSKLEIEFEVIQSMKVKGLTEFYIIEKGHTHAEITYQQFKKPTKKVYLNKIEKALHDIIKKYFADN